MGLETANTGPLYLLLRHVTLSDAIPVRGHRFRPSRLLMPPYNSEEAFLVQAQIGVFLAQFAVATKSGWIIDIR